MRQPFNQQFLADLEAYIRQIVQEELQASAPRPSQAPNFPQVPTPNLDDEFMAAMRSSATPSSSNDSSSSDPLNGRDPLDVLEEILKETRQRQSESSQQASQPQAQISAPDEPQLAPRAESHLPSKTIGTAKDILNRVTSKM